MFWLASVILVIGLALGGSQAMRTAWIEDCLSLLPPILFLVATSLERRPATRRFPFGFHRTAFFAAAAALLAFGAIPLHEAVVTLVRQDHPVMSWRPREGRDEAGSPEAPTGTAGPGGR